MNKDDLILEILKEIKEDVKIIKENYVTKEVCNLKCETSSKRTAVITSTIASAVPIIILVLKALLFDE